MTTTIRIDAAAFLQKDAYTERHKGDLVGNGRYEVLYTSRDVNGTREPTRGSK